MQKAQLYWEQKLSQDLVNKAALEEFMETHQMSELDVKQLMQKSPQVGETSHKHRSQDSVNKQPKTQDEKEVVEV